MRYATDEVVVQIGTHAGCTRRCAVAQRDDDGRGTLGGDGSVCSERWTSYREYTTVWSVVGDEACRGLLVDGIGSAEGVRVVAVVGRI